MSPVPFHQVKMQDEFWAPRVEGLASNTLPHAIKNTAQAVERLRLTAEYIRNGGGPKPNTHRFVSSDLFKVMEGAALMIKAQPNAGVEKQMDEIIEVIGQAQAKDGYLYASHQTDSSRVSEMGEKPYSWVVHSHELYNMGHMYEAAAAYYQATGKDAFLKIAEKSAQHVNRVFFEGDPNYNDGKPVNQAPGHQEIELGLIKLYRVTGKNLYLDMAKKFLDIRGVTYRPEGKNIMSPSYAQQQKPVAEQEKAVGHAVRAVYQYAAMAEVDSELGSEDYTWALDKIWHNIVDTKMHITGGLGAVHGIEGFGPEYMLPNEHAYNETCAAVANVFFNYRMFLKYRDAKYLDVAEVSLLNNSLAGVSLDGKSFFYPNPLEVKSKHKHRSVWFGTGCCPANIARLIPQLPGYMYTHTSDEIYCALYGGSQTTLELEKGAVELLQQTGYPFDGVINFTLNPAQPQAFALKLRIPTWAGDQFVPGKLYAYTTPTTPWSLSVNGERLQLSVDKGFVTVERTWQKGDKVTLNLPMDVKLNTCLEKVEANIDRLAVTRGPLVYCAEQVDNGGMVQRFFLGNSDLARTPSVETMQGGPLDGLPLVTIPVSERSVNEAYSASMKMVPYYAWANRGPGSMNVWFGTKPSMAELDYTQKGMLKFAVATASHTFKGDTVEAVRMLHHPKSSRDESIPRWTSWPQKGKEQWVEIDLGTEQKVQRFGVYWYDDDGGVQVPGEWHLETGKSKNGPWQKVKIYNTDQYSSIKDSYNSVQAATQLETRYLRVVMKPQHNQTTVGILSLSVE
jgi:DUF1680 family protein